jgi:hypothetical protein
MRVDDEVVRLVYGVPAPLPWGRDWAAGPAILAVRFSVSPCPDQGRNTEPGRSWYPLSLSSWGPP